METDGCFVIETDGARHDVEVRPSKTEHDVMDEILAEMSEDERAAFGRELDEAAEEAERDGPVPADQLRRDLDEAKARGLKVWNARHGITD